jgi:hypothetical protein
MTITRSELEKWTPDHLHQFASHFTQLGHAQPDTMDAINSGAGQQDWLGIGKVGQDATLAIENSLAITDAAQMGAAALEATAGAHSLYGTQQFILAAVKSYEAQQFTVHDDWSVTDNLQSIPAVAQARQAVAQGISSELQQHVGTFEAQETATATGILTSLVTPPDQSATQPFLSQYQGAVTGTQTPRMPGPPMPNTGPLPSSGPTSMECARAQDQAREQSVHDMWHAMGRGATVGGIGGLAAGGIDGGIMGSLGGMLGGEVATIYDGVVDPKVPDACK